MGRVLGGKQLDLVGQVDGGRNGPGGAAFSRENHLGVDKVEAAGGDQEGVVIQGEAVSEEGAIRVGSPEQGVLFAGVPWGKAQGIGAGSGSGSPSLREQALDNWDGRWDGSGVKPAFRGKTN